MRLGMRKLFICEECKELFHHISLRRPRKHVDLQLACFWVVITLRMGIMTHHLKSGQMSNVLCDKTRAWEVTLIWC